MTRHANRTTTIKDAAWEIMEEAYLKASAQGTLPAHARQIMYAARPYIQEETGKLLDDKYFTQTLLPDYIEQNEPTDWNVVFDGVCSGFQCRPPLLRRSEVDQDRRMVCGEPRSWRTQDSIRSAAVTTADRHDNTDLW